MKNAGQVLSFIEELLGDDLLRYQMFVSGLERLLVASMLETDMSEKTANEFRQVMTDTLQKAQSSERKATDAQIKRLLALTKLPASTSGAALVQIAQKTLRDAVTTQMRRDALTVEAHFQRIRTTAYLINEARPMGHAYAMRLAYLRNKQLLKHVFVDRAGRRWSGPTYIRTVFREHYLGLVNDLEVLSLGEQGATEAAYVYPNGRTIRFSLGESGALPSYEEVKHLHFHPNSSALVYGTLTSE